MESISGCAERCAVFFDSGIGGLNLMYQCVKRAPWLKYYYVSDNYNVPYGNRSADEIYSLVLNALDGIERLRPAALVIACNTVTAQCIGELRKRYGFPVIGIQPAIKQAAETGGRCLVLATSSTVKSNAFRNLSSHFPNIDIRVHECKTLAAFVEENVFNLPESLPSWLLPEESADSVVLGCTHYVYVKRQIEAKYNCPVYDGISGTADHFAKIVGMSDHGHTFLGKFDHFFSKGRKIVFLGGNIDKNNTIFCGFGAENL